MASPRCRLTLPSRGQLPGYALQLHLMSNVGPETRHSAMTRWTNPEMRVDFCSTGRRTYVVKICRDQARLLEMNPALIDRATTWLSFSGCWKISSECVARSKVLVRLKMQRRCSRVEDTQWPRRSSSRSTSSNSTSPTTAIRGQLAVSPRRASVPPRPPSESPRLRNVYGRGRWRKRKGIATVRLHDGSILRAEVHWCEATGIGNKEFKIKRIIE